MLLAFSAPPAHWLLPARSPDVIIIFNFDLCCSYMIINAVALIMIVIV